MARSVGVHARVLAAILLVAACGPVPPPVTGSSAPAPRTDASSAFDPSTGDVVMFGGASRSGVLDETWTWSGSGWTRQHPSASPPAREFAYMAYDYSTSRVVIFGGMTCAAPAANDPIGCDYQAAATNLHDTWAWDGRTWGEVRTQHTPPSENFRDAGGMASDPKTKELLLVAYSGNPANPTVETWTLRGGDWVQLRPAHSPWGDEFGAPAFDAVSGHVLVEQMSPPSDPPRPFGDITWSWDGADWRDLGASVKSPHSPGTLVSAGPHGVILFFGGGWWQWNGRSWSDVRQLPQVVSFALRARLGETLAYHEPTHTLVMFGGRAGFGTNHLMGDTAGWDGKSWKTLVPPVPSPRAALPPCSAKQAISGSGASPNGLEVDFFEPLAGPCHLHVTVELTLVAGNDALQIAGNPARQPVDADLTWDAGGQAAVFDITNACALPQNTDAHVHVGDYDFTMVTIAGYPPCSGIPSVRSSVRATGLRP